MYRQNSYFIYIIDWLHTSLSRPVSRMCRGAALSLINFSDSKANHLLLMESSVPEPLFPFFDSLLNWKITFFIFTCTSALVMFISCAISVQALFFKFLSLYWANVVSQRTGLPRYSSIRFITSSRDHSNSLTVFSIGINTMKTGELNTSI